MEIILRVPDWLITGAEKFANTFFTKKYLWFLLVALLAYVYFLSVLWCMDRLFKYLFNLEQNGLNGKAVEKLEKPETETRNQELPTYTPRASNEEKKSNVFIVTMPEETK